MNGVRGELRHSLGEPAEETAKSNQDGQRLAQYAARAERVTGACERRGRLHEANIRAEPCRFVKEWSWRERNQ
jgi:hypothetical protein